MWWHTVTVALALVSRADIGRPTRIDRPTIFDSLIGPKTRAILVNTPHNPTGRVFSREELTHIATLCVEHGRDEGEDCRRNGHHEERLR